MRVPKRRVIVRAAIAILVVGVAAAWKAGVFAFLSPAPEPLRVRVIGHSWWWEFDYPDLRIKTANEMHLPVGTNVELELTSVDVLHTLSIPELSVRADAIPGQVNHLQTQVDAPGALGGECSEICGIAHSMMRAKVVAESQVDFDAWAAHQQKPAAVPQTEQELSGYDMLSTACSRCHSLDPGEERTDLVGPNLAHLMSRSVFAGASFTLDESNLRRWIRDTQAMKAGNDMVVKLARDDYLAVVEYLLLLR